MQFHSEVSQTMDLKTQNHCVHAPCEITPKNVTDLHIRRSSLPEIPVSKPFAPDLTWIKPRVPDTIQFEFIADGMILDTLEMAIKKPEKKVAGLAKNIFKKQEAKADTIKISRIKIESNASKSKAELNQKVKLDFDYPLETFDFSQFVWMEDSLATTPDIQFTDQSKRHLIINKELVEKHFGDYPDLEKILITRGELRELELVTDTSKGIASINFVTQDEPLGLGHAVWCAREYINDGPFAVLLPDDLVQADPGCMGQMVDAFNQYGGNIVAVEDVPREQTNKYGILDVTEDDGRIASAKGLVEKPNPEDAPSTLSVIGRYILGPEVLEHLELRQKGAGGEIQLTDAIAATIGHVDFRGLRFAGQRFDCGSKGGFVAANVA